MIVGSGAVASVLQDRDDRLYFAAGVANSRETRQSEFKREYDLLRSQQRHRHAVYFSTLSIFTRDTLYTRHKLYMEGLVKELFPCWTIMRLGNIDWATNPNQLYAFLRDRIRSGYPFEIFDEYRHVVGVDELLYWIGVIPPWNCEMNVPGRRMKVSEIVFELKHK